MPDNQTVMNELKRRGIAPNNENVQAMSRLMYQAGMREHNPMTRDISRQLDNLVQFDEELGESVPDDETRETAPVVPVEVNPIDEMIEATTAAPSAGRTAPKKQPAPVQAAPSEPQMTPIPDGFYEQATPMSQDDGNDVVGGILAAALAGGTAYYAKTRKQSTPINEAPTPGDAGKAMPAGSSEADAAATKAEKPTASVPKPKPKAVKPNSGYIAESARPSAMRVNPKAMRTVINAVR